MRAGQVHFDFFGFKQTPFGVIFSFHHARQIVFSLRTEFGWQNRHCRNKPASYPGVNADQRYGKRECDAQHDAFKQNISSFSGSTLPISKNTSGITKALLMMFLPTLESAGQQCLCSCANGVNGEAILPHHKLGRCRYNPRRTQSRGCRHIGANPGIRQLRPRASGLCSPEMSAEQPRPVQHHRR